MIRAAIIGYGNLGRSVERVIADQPDMELVGVLSRRDSLDTDAKVLPTTPGAAGRRFRSRGRGPSATSWRWASWCAPR